ncbi:hypothetical protein DICVIV_01479 [Dictyocaulus viviparus]|uniref:SXP/RAL-2 family protein Ani s 5-like cation-binding domain-containing protein n=1 Tax=Dictyocaulus viviparus TaxID=29172 RepID=A0A0D8Y7W6_DICVI|nr:hypothetical protein DICVIV_01479 [Dictyocaulus viviparus]
MTTFILRRIILISLSFVVISQQHFPQDTNGGQDVHPSWYRMPSGYVYSRNEWPQITRPTQASSMNSYSYSSLDTNQPLYPELTIGAASLNRHYPRVGQEKPCQTSLSRYHQLLVKKQQQLLKQKQLNVTNTVKAILPKSLRTIYSTIIPSMKLTTNPSIIPQRKIITTTAEMPETTENIVTTDVTTPHTTREIEATTTKELSCCETTTTATSSSTKNSLWEDLLTKAELLAAIKEIVSKLKASLDNVELDEDARLMSDQLRNKWQQLTTGPKNEHLTRLLRSNVGDVQRNSHVRH